MIQDDRRATREMQKMEKVFGKIEVFRLLKNENILGTIEDIPVFSQGSVGRATATITDQRFLFESEMMLKEKRYSGTHDIRDVFYYEMKLDKIDGIQFESSDISIRRGKVYAFILLLLAGLALTIIDATSIHTIVVTCLGIVVMLLSFLYLPIKRRSRVLSFQLQTSSGPFVLGRNKESDLDLVVTNECISKMTLLAKGIREAQMK